MIEEGNNGGCGAEAFEDGFVQGGLGGEIRGKPGAEAPLAAADQVVSGVFFAETLRWAGEWEALGGFPLGC